MKQKTSPKNVRQPTAAFPCWRAPGELITLRVPEKTERFIDGFYISAESDTLLVFIHGMGSNFYRSMLKKAFLEAAPKFGLAMLSINNRGADRGTEDEPFRACLADLDATVAFARSEGFRRIVLIGHSTGCQKIAFWQAKRQAKDVALVLLSPADDNAILARDFGSRFEKKIAWARKCVADGKGDARLQAGYETFTAERFLSVADPRREEASVFRYAGPLTHFRRIRCPIVSVFGEAEEFAVLPPEQMLAILRSKTASKDFDDWLIPGADHSFHGCEMEIAAMTCLWAKEWADAD